jgi:hypothetical protein
VGDQRTKPTQGHATQKPNVFRRRGIGGIYSPSPSPPGFPLYKDKGWVCSLRSFRFAPIAPVANPSSTAQRGRDRPLPVVGGGKVEKKAGIHAAPPMPRRGWSYFAPPGPSALPAPPNPPHGNPLKATRFMNHTIRFMKRPQPPNPQGTPPSTRPPSQPPAVRADETKPP